MGFSRFHYIAGEYDAAGDRDAFGIAELHQSSIAPTPGRRVSESMAFAREFPQATWMSQSESETADNGGMEFDDAMLQTIEKTDDIAGYTFFKIETLRRYNDRVNENVIRVIHAQNLRDFFTGLLEENELVLDIRPFSEERIVKEESETET